MPCVKCRVWTTRTVADGCERLRTVAVVNATSSEHTLNPQATRLKREPLLRIREKHAWQCETVPGKLHRLGPNPAMSPTENAPQCVIHSHLFTCAISAVSSEFCGNTELIRTLVTWKKRWLQLKHMSALVCSGICSSNATVATIDAVIGEFGVAMNTWRCRSECDHQKCQHEAAGKLTCTIIDFLALFALLDLLAKCAAVQ